MDSKDFEPIDSANRLRKGIYPLSAALRYKTNGRKEIHVNSIDEIPDGGFVEAWLAVFHGASKRNPWAVFLP